MAQTGRAFGGGGSSVLRGRGQVGQLPSERRDRGGRRPSGGAHRRPFVSAGKMDAEPGALPGGWRAGGSNLRDETGNSLGVGCYGGSASATVAGESSMMFSWIPLHIVILAAQQPPCSQEIVPPASARCHG